MTETPQVPNHPQNANQNINTEKALDEIVMNDTLMTAKKDFVDSVNFFENAFRKNLNYLLKTLVNRNPLLGAFITSDGRIRRPEEIPHDYIAELLAKIIGIDVGRDYAMYSGIYEITFPEIPAAIRTMLYKTFAPLANYALESLSHAYKFIKDDLKKLVDKVYSGAIKRGSEEYNRELKKIADKFSRSFDARFSTAATLHYFANMASELVHGLVYAFNKMLEKDYTSLFSPASTQGQQ